MFPEALYDAVRRVEGILRTKPKAGAAPSHQMVFTPPDGESELMCLDVPDILPIPGQGKIILLHEYEVMVTSSRTIYARDEKTGQVKVFTVVRVTAVE
ncbi:MULTISPECIES: hypothetical protein [Streptomyces]|uniref:Uncharacterized protein n=2 Tax=Streptomyces TaxID=1883 RepID=A0A1E7LPP2_9ACTN|nr:hypothetical protein [Streptomyces nanshensis]OEV18184.1 hypothetical protein AN221_23895 [Streptomyces nanshensis]